MLHPDDPIRGRLLLGYEQQLIDEMMQCEADKQPKKRIKPMLLNMRWRFYPRGSYINRYSRRYESGDQQSYWQHG